MDWFQSSVIGAMYSSDPEQNLSSIPPKIRNVMRTILSVVVQNTERKKQELGPSTPSEDVVASAERVHPYESIITSRAPTGVNVRYEKTQEVFETYLASLREKQHRDHIRPIRNVTDPSSYEHELERKLQLKRKQTVDVGELEDRLHKKRNKVYEEMAPNRSAFANEIRDEITRRDLGNETTFY